MSGLDGNEALNSAPHVIRVTRANYGRFSIALCNEEGRTDWSVNCFAPKTKGLITQR